MVVNQVKIAELLYAMARDAQPNLDVRPGGRGNVTINAIEQAMQQMLKRLCRAIDLRHEFDGRILAGMPHAPFARH